ncbi:MAG: peroxiredoxin-like family protein [Mariprofundus sp.]|nr:peroxiredoxin-like family protein [Mariprofundus sp.]
MNHQKEVKRDAGDGILPISLPAIDNSTFELESMKGKRYMLSFFRFASCPFCNLRLHELVKRHNELGEEFGIVAIFDSPLDNLQQHADGHHAPFPILADEDNRYYREYAIEHSVVGVFKGMILRMPTLIKGILKGYVPTTIKGSMTTMPADFLVDENGTIQLAHYGHDEGDHLSFEKVKAFALKGYLRK